MAEEQEHLLATQTPMVVMYMRFECGTRGIGNGKGVARNALPGRHVLLSRCSGCRSVCGGGVAGRAVAARTRGAEAGGGRGQIERAVARTSVPSPASDRERVAARSARLLKLTRLLHEVAVR